VIGPIDLDEVRPGGDGEVLAEADAASACGGSFESGPGADAGLMAVGTDDPTGASGVAIRADLPVLDALDYGFPAETNAKGCGAVEKQLVEEGAADAPANGVGEESFAFYRVAVTGIAEKTDAAQGEAFGSVQRNAEFRKGGDGIGQETLAAGFVNGWPHAVGDFNLKALRGSSDGTGQTGRASTGYEDVNIVIDAANAHKTCLPLQKNKLGTEGWAHGGKDAVAAWSSGVIEEVILHDSEDRGGGEIAHFAQALP